MEDSDILYKNGTNERKILNHFINKIDDKLIK